MTVPAAPTRAARLEAGLLSRWYGSPGVLWLLLPLEGLFRVFGRVRRWAYRKGWLASRKPSLPVLVVGNISIGGTGKTPVTIAICRALRAAGWQPGIASRGYGSRAGSYPQAVTPATPVSDSGDEPLLLARRSGCPVVISPKRFEAAELLQQQYGCDVLVCDDGLQHYALGRDIEWVVVDGERGFGNGHCLPLGPLREPLSRLRTADAVLVNGDTIPASALSAVVRQTSSFKLQPTGVLRLGDGEPVATADFVARHPRVHAVAGIGNPSRFFATLRSLGLIVVEHPFPDHHVFSLEDFAFHDEIPVVMTEKDAVKCADLTSAPTDRAVTPPMSDLPSAGVDVWYLTVEAQLSDSLIRSVTARIAALANR